MSKSVVLHIGIHRSGTTAIQRALLRHAPKLNSANIGFPVPVTRNGAHHALCLALENGHRRSVAELVEASPYPTVLLTSERFCTLSAQRISELAASLGQHDTRIVIYLRNPFARLQSSYCQQVKIGATTATPSEWISRRVIPRRNARRDYELIKPWISGCSRDRVSVQVYENVQGPIVKHMLNAAALRKAANAIPSDDNERYNASLPLNTLETLRQVQIALGHEAKSLTYRRLIKRTLLPALRPDTASPKGSIFTRDELRQIAEANRESVQAIHNEICPLPESYFTPPELPYVRPQADAEEVKRLMSLIAEAA